MIPIRVRADTINFFIDDNTFLEPRRLGVSKYWRDLQDEVWYHTELTFLLPVKLMEISIKVEGLRILQQPNPVDQTETTGANIPLLNCHLTTQQIPLKYKIQS